MNQSRLAERILNRLHRQASQDARAWVPAVGWMNSEGVPHGIGIELFGEAPTDTQLRVLQRVLFRLAAGGSIEIAAFRHQGPRTTRLVNPQRQPHQTYLELAGPGSGKLRPNATYEYGVRIAQHDA